MDIMFSIWSEAVRVGAAGEAPPLEVLGGSVVGEDPLQRLPLDGGGVPRQPLELGDHLLPAELVVLLLCHLANGYGLKMIIIGGRWSCTRALLELWARHCRAIPSLASVFFLIVS